ncbi:spore coat protein U domain-containing protein, partial [Acinetobacter baumannii]
MQFNQGAPNSSNSVRSLGSGANAAIHELSSDSGRTQVWGSWGYGTTAYGSGGVSINLSLPLLGGPAQQSLTVYGRFL